MSDLTQPLWPKPIPVIGLTGEYASGKTLFALTICPGPGTLVYDLEKSSESYLDLGFHRIDAHLEMLKSHPKGYKPRELWSWWKASIMSIPTGKYRVIVLDPISEIENALVDYVQSHPGEFGRTSSQYAKASGLMWGDVKQEWKQVLSDLASRCETFCFVAHMGQVYQGNTPTGRRKPKGKETLEELASLYLQLERRPDAKGNTPAVPSAIVRKNRQLHIRVTDAGLETCPALPPRIPVATPNAIRQYQLTPPDYANLKEEEKAPEVKVTEEELAELRARAAEAEAETERIKLERMDRMERQRLKPIGEEMAAAPAAPPPPPAEPAKANQSQLEAIRDLRKDLFAITKPEDPTATWQAVLAKRGVKTAHDLTEADADALAESLRRKIDTLKRAEIPF